MAGNEIFDNLIPFSIDTSFFTLTIHLGIMFWGALFRYWYENRKLDLFSWLIFLGYGSAWLIAGILATLYYIFVNPDIDVLRHIIPYTLGLSLFSVMATYLRLKSALLIWLGTISYSLYLFHSVTLHALNWWVQNSEMSWLKGWTTGSYMLVAALSAVLISAFTYRYIELPSIRIGSYLSRKEIRKEPANVI